LNKGYQLDCPDHYFHKTNQVNIRNLAESGHPACPRQAVLESKVEKSFGYCDSFHCVPASISIKNYLRLKKACL
jgi:hypothetical protein